MRTSEKNVSSESTYFINLPSEFARKNFLYPLQCGDFTYMPEYSLHRNSLNSFLLMYIKSGSMIVECGGTMYTASSHDFVLLDCFAPHGYSSPAGCQCIWVHFDGPSARDSFQAITECMGNVFTLENQPAVTRKMMMVVSFFSENKPPDEPLLNKYLTDIITEFYEGLTKSGISGKKDDIEAVVSFINEHFQENLTLDDLAASAGFSKYHFLRIFKEETGFSPHGYIIARRMATARFLLKSTSLSSKEICFQTGFSSESVFCSAFKKFHGISPLSYRENSDLS